MHRSNKTLKIIAIFLTVTLIFYNIYTIPIPKRWISAQLEELYDKIVPEANAQVEGVAFAVLIISLCIIWGLFEVLDAKCDKREVESKECTIKICNQIAIWIVEDVFGGSVGSVDNSDPDNPSSEVKETFGTKVLDDIVRECSTAKYSCTFGPVLSQAGTWHQNEGIHFDTDDIQCDVYVPPYRKLYSGFADNRGEYDRYHKFTIESWDRDYTWCGGAGLYVKIYDENFTFYIYSIELDAKWKDSEIEIDSTEPIGWTLSDPCIDYTVEIRVPKPGIEHPNLSFENCYNPLYWLLDPHHSDATKYAVTSGEVNLSTPSAVDIIFELWESTSGTKYTHFEEIKIYRAGYPENVIDRICFGGNPNNPRVNVVGQQGSENVTGVDPLYSYNSGNYANLGKYRIYFANLNLEGYSGYDLELYIDAEEVHGLNTQKFRLKIDADDWAKPQPVIIPLERRY